MTAPARARRRRRTAGCAAAAALLLLALLAVRVLVGTPMVPVDLALRALSGENVPGISFIVMDHRLPVAVVAVLAGTAFGLSGTTFQTLLRNPLASPDVIGVTVGASAGAVIAMAFFQADGRALFWFALLGGLGTAALLLVVSGAGRPGRRRGQPLRAGGHRPRRRPPRADLLPAHPPLPALRRGRDALDDRLAVLLHLGPAVLAAALLVLIPALALLVVRLRILQLGDDFPASLGLSVPRARVALILVAVALSALTVAVTGPLSFVAFLAGPLAPHDRRPPQLPARRRDRCRDRAGRRHRRQNLFGTTELPAGVITGALGAPFLLWMLTRTPSSGSGR